MSLLAGRLNRRVTIERASAPTQSASGQPMEVWETLAGPLWASIEPLSGSERSADPNVAAHEQVEITIRRSAAVADVNPKDRANHRGQLYDIQAVHEVELREGLRLVAQRVAD